MFNRAKDRRDAVNEAVRFLQRMEDLEADIKSRGGSEWVHGSPVESGAARRASLDLTRALAKLRKYGDY